MGISPFLGNIKKRKCNHLLDGLDIALSRLGGLLGSFSALGIYDFFVEAKTNTLDFFNTVNMSFLLKIFIGFIKLQS